MFTNTTVCHRSSSFSSVFSLKGSIFGAAMLIFSFMLLSFSATAQTQLIPLADGGFENATSSFAANGWTPIQPGNTRQWQVGTAASSVTGGTKSAYVGTTSNYNGANNTSVQHFYRDIVIPAAASNVQFSFHLRRPTVDPGDNLFVYRTTTANTPVSGTVPGAGYTSLFSENTTTYAGYTLMSAVDLSALAGTTVRLVFTFQSDGSNPNSNPAVDNIRISCFLPPVISGFASSSACAGGSITINGTNLASASAVTIGGTAVSSITTNTDNQIVAVVGSGTTGLVNVTTPGGSSNSPSSFTVNPLPVAYSVTGGGVYCFGGAGVPVGLSGSEAGVNYTLTPGAVVVAGTGSAISFGNRTTVGTYTVSATNATTGCTAAMTGSVAISLVNAVAITTQPSNQSICSGSSVSFSVTATGGGLSYQWRKGNTNIANGGAVSGATSATLTINPAAVGDAASDYNCVITNVCGSETSNYAELTVTAPAVIPPAQPTVLSFPTIGVTSVIGSFTASASTTNYLVVRTSSITPPSNPVNGTNYAVGSTALGAGTFVEYNGIETTFSSNGLNQGTTYYYWVFAFNTSACGTSPVYLTASPLSGSVTTLTNIACGSINTLYWAGTGSTYTNPSATAVFNTASNWSTSSSAYVASLTSPSGCSNVNIRVSAASVVIILNANASVYGMDFKVSGGRVGRISTEGFTLTVNDNADIDLLAGAVNNSTVIIGENNGSAAGVVDFKANLRIGINSATAGSNKASMFRGNINSKIICRADVTLGRTFAISGASNPGTIEFDGAGLQEVLWNNDLYFANFNNVVVGNVNNPVCRHVTGTYTPDNILNNLTVNGSSVLDLATSQWIRNTAGGVFSLNGTARMILSNNQSIVSPSSGLGVVIPGSNFPGGFSTLNISSTSTVEYNAVNSLTQTIYNVPTYGNLVLSNGGGTGVSNKINTGTVTASGTTEIKSNASWTMGAGFVSNGASSVKNGGILYTNNQLVTGTGSFTLESGGTIDITSAQGITSSGATGSIRTSTRSFSTGGNYIYTGSVAMATGNGLPTTMNNLTINNTAGVTLFAASSNYTVSGILRQTAGAFLINGNTLTINSLIRTSGTLSSSSASSITINGTNVPLFFTAGARFVRNLTFNNNATGSLETPLEVVAGVNYGTLSVGSGSVFATNNRLTLRSNAAGTARVAEIPSDPGTGAALGSITGNVSVERFFSAQKAWRLVGVATAGSATFRQSWQENQASGTLAPAGRGIQISGSTFPANGFDMYSAAPSVKVWNSATGAYVGITSTFNPIANDDGYMVFVRGDRTINTTVQAPTTTLLRSSGTLKTGRYPAAPINVGAGQFKSIANPYASAINFNQVTRTGGVPNIFYVWDPLLTSGPNSAYGLGGFRTMTWNAGTGTYIVTPSGGSYTTNTDIESGSAFFVYAPLSSGTVIFNESCKTNGSNLVSRPGTPDGGILQTNLFVYSGGDTIMIDGNMAQFGAYSNRIDEEDALKLNNTGENIGIRRDNKTYIVERRSEINEADTIPFALGQMRQRTYRFEFTASRLSQNGMTAFLEDQFLQTRRPIDLEGKTYVDFTVSNVPGSFASNRFRVVFRSQKRTVSTEINRLSAVRNSNGQVNIQWQVTNEMRIRQYDIERSTDGQNFRAIRQAEPGANDGSTMNYQQLDELAPASAIFYRIKGSRLTGSDIIYSDVIRVNSQFNPMAESLGRNTGTALLSNGQESLAGSVAVFPNPVENKTINLSFNQMNAGDYRLQLVSGSGQLVYKGTITVQSGKMNRSVSIGESVPPGSYQLMITGEGQSTQNISLIVK